MLNKEDLKIYKTSIFLYGIACIIGIFLLIKSPDLKDINLGIITFGLNFNNFIILGLIFIPIFLLLLILIFNKLNDANATEEVMEDKDGN